VHEARAEPLQELALAEHDRDLAERTAASLAAALERRCRTQQADEQ
jgi:hypothetical protein